MLPEVTLQTVKHHIHLNNFLPLEQIMAEDQKYGALVPICDVFQEEVPLDPASGTRRYGDGWDRAVERLRFMGFVGQNYF